MGPLFFTEETCVTYCMSHGTYTRPAKNLCLLEESLAEK